MTAERADDLALAARHVARARELLALRRYDLAIVAALDAIAANATDATAVVLLANSYERLGRVREADAAANRAIELAPENPRAHTSLGLVRCLQRRYVEALARFREASRLAPEYGDAYRLAAHAQMMLRRYRDALASLDRALELDPESITALEVRVLVLRASGRKGEADAATAHLLSRDPSSVLGLSQYAIRQLERGASHEARATLREALRLEPNAARLHAAYASVVVRSGRSRWLGIATIALFYTLVTIANVVAGRSDMATFGALFAGMTVVRRCAIVEVLRRDEIGRTFLGSGELAANGRALALAVAALILATADASPHARALTTLSIGISASLLIGKASTLVALAPPRARTFRNVARGFAALSLALAAIVAATPQAFGPSIRVQLAALAVATIVAGKSDPRAVSSFLRALVPRVRVR